MKNLFNIPEVIVYKIINDSSQSKKIILFDFDSTFRQKDPALQIYCVSATIDRNAFINKLSEKTIDMPWQLFFYAHLRLLGIQIIPKDRPQFVNPINIYEKDNPNKETFFNPINYLSASSMYPYTILVPIDEMYKRDGSPLFMTEKTAIETTINAKETVEYRFCFDQELYDILKVYHGITF